MPAMGITTHLDQGGFPSVGDNTDGLANFDRYRAFDAVLEPTRRRSSPTGSGSTSCISRTP
jgi:hypothetical protein